MTNSVDHLLGPNPHKRPRHEVLAAYANGVGVVLPQIFAVPRLPAAQVRALALRRFRALVAHAKTTVPYYRTLFADLDPGALVDEQAVGAVPFLTKALLRAHHEEMVSETAAPRAQLLERQSSGSSGSPIKVVFDPVKEIERRLQELRFLTAHGYKPWDLQLIFDNPAHVPKEKMLPQKLGLLRRQMFPFLSNADDAVAEVNKIRPEILHGVLAGLRLLAIAIKKGRPLTYTPKLVISKGELLDPGTRDLIESAFGARLVDYYATEETGIIAWECPSRAGYHVDQDLCLLEIVDDDGRPVPPGTRGEICLTNLYTKTMPIIRYRVGDLGVLSPTPCPCGRGLPLLTNLHGRKLDLIVTPEGEVHDPFGVIAKIEEVRAVRMFRLTQDAVDHLDVKIQWDETLDAAGKAAAARDVEAHLRQRVGQGIKIDIVEVPDFAQSLHRKFPLVKGLGLSPEEITQRGYRLRF